jgi:Zn-dependent protease with chaperone function
MERREEMNAVGQPDHGSLARRRNLFLLIAGLALFGMTPVFGHHLEPRLVAIGGGTDHVLGMCLVALREIFRPVHDAFHVILASGLAYALWDRSRAWFHLRRTLGSLQIKCPDRGDVFWNAAIEADVPPPDLYIVHGLPAAAFTAGWVAPRIYLSSNLEHILSTPELAAVIAHEAEHVRARDPLRLSVFRFLANTMFYLPTLRRLIEDLADEAEIAADDAAVRRSSTRALALASALIAVANQHAPPVPRAAVGLQRDDLLDRRVKRLAGERSTVRTHVTRRSLACAAAILLLVWTSGLVMASPLAGQAAWNRSSYVNQTLAGPRHSLLHCNHKNMWAVGHLFCERNLHKVVSRCPHTGSMK